MGWLSSLVQCNICTHKFASVYPECVDESELECPSCGSQDSVILERWCPNGKLIIFGAADLHEEQQ